MDIYDDLFLAFSIKGEIENSKNLSDIYFLAEEKDYFFNITLKSDIDICKIEFVTQLCYKPSMRKSGYDYCSFIENSKNNVHAFGECTLKTIKNSINAKRQQRRRRRCSLV